MKLILLVEDDPGRAARIQSCIPAEARCIWARSAGAAIGILKRDAFVCVFLDHDLEAHSESSNLDGRAVARAVAQTQSRETCSVLIHSQNVIGGPAMVSFLRESVFRVERCPWSEDAGPVMREWLVENLKDD